MRKSPVLSKVIALLILISSAPLFIENVILFDFESFKLAFQPSFKPLPKGSHIVFDVEEANRIRREALISRIKEIIFNLALVGAISSSLAMIIRESRIWHIVLGSASFGSLIMFLIIFWKGMPDLESFKIDIIGSIYFYLFALINLFGAIYFLPKSKTILTSRST